MRTRTTRVAVSVPRCRMRGRRQLALAQDARAMGPRVVLAPVDPQLGENPASSLMKVVAQKPIAEVDDQTLIHADIAEKAVNQLRESAAELLTRSMPAEKAKDLAARLSAGTRTHEHPITVEEGQ